jgi:hypothetical protein
METRQSEAAGLLKPWQLVGGKETEITRFKRLSTSCSFAGDARASMRILVNLFGDDVVHASHNHMATKINNFCDRVSEVDV